MTCDVLPKSDTPICQIMRLAVVGLSPDEDDDCSGLLRFLLPDDECVMVDKFVFFRYARKFRSDEKFFDTSEIDLSDTNYELEAFEAFCQACENRPIIVNADNFLMLRKIARDFDCPSVLKLVDSFIANEKEKGESEHDISIWIRMLLWNLGNNESDNKESTDDQLQTPDIEAHIAHYLGFAVTDPRMLELPLEVVTRIFKHKQRKPVNAHALTAFVLKYAAATKEQGGNVSELMDLICSSAEGVSSFSPSEITEICKGSYFPTVVHGEYSFKLISDVTKQINEQHSLISSLKEGRKGDTSQAHDVISEICRPAMEQARRTVMDHMRPEEDDFPVLSDAELNVLERETMELTFHAIRRVAYKNPRNGVFATIRNEEGMDAVSAGKVRVITSVQPRGDDIQTQDIMNFARCDGACLKLDAEADDTWVQFCFGDCGLQVAGMTLQMVTFDDESCEIVIPCSFYLAGSNDEENWTPLIDVNDCKEFSVVVDEACFMCRTLSCPYKFVRYVQRDAYDRPAEEMPLKIRSAMRLSAIEFFGILE